MARQIINVGTSPNDHQGDSLRVAGIKINSNFSEVYNIAQNAWNTANTTGNTGNANTGTITFTDDTIEGQYSVQISPNSVLTANSQYFRFRSGDDDRHLHFDTSNNSEFDLFLGDDSKFVQINHTGNVVIQSQDTNYYATHAWIFGANGVTTFPTLTVPISDNSNPSGTGQVLKFGDFGQQAIIYGPEATPSSSAQRIVIQGAPGYTDTSGEGGDIYLWAGPGGSANGSGGDIKIRGGLGNGTNSGGYLNFQAGDTDTGTGGYINIESGSSNIYGFGGDINVQARSGGIITLRTYGASNNTQNWQFGTDGNLALPGDGHGIIFNQSTDAKIKAEMGTIVIESSTINLHVTSEPGNVAATWQFGTDGSITFPDTSTQTKAFNDGLIVPVLINTSTPYYTSTSEQIIFVDANAAGDNVTVYLTATPQSGRKYTVKNINAGAYDVYIQPDGGTTPIETETGTIGAGYYATLSVSGQSITWVFDGTSYRIISSHGI